MIKHVVTRGYGLTPGSVKFIPTRGYISGGAAAPATTARTIQFRRHYGIAMSRRQGE